MFQPTNVTVQFKVGRQSTPSLPGEPQRAKPFKKGLPQ